jgi:hypothetical protein
MTKIYALVNKTTKTVENLVVWDGNLSTWKPPATHDAILSGDNKVKVWGLDEGSKIFNLVAHTGHAAIGQKFDGEFFIDQTPKPIYQEAKT